MSTVTPIGNPLVGHVFGGRYLILEKRARGGMATVFKARDTRLDRIVAVKVMHEGLGDDVDFAAKFDKEARAAARLSHPNIVGVFDQGSDRGRPYIVMEYVAGRTLRQIISSDAPISPRQALEYMEPVVRALAAAHEVGLVHCDVKPENVLISERGVVKVADFGLAKAVTGQTVTASQGLLIGTVSYIPPELVTSGKATSRSDVYSTGVVLYELLTGRKPHTGDSPIQVAYSHVHTDIEAPSKVATVGRGRPAIPDYVDALVLACTRRSPADRPADATELARRLSLARRALDAQVTSDPDLAAELGAGPGGAAVTTVIADGSEDRTAPVRVIPPVAITPVAPRTSQRRTPVTPIEPSRWNLRTNPRGRAPMATPVSPVDLDPADDETLTVRTTSSPTTPVRPLVRISQQPVHRRRRSLVMVFLVLLLCLVTAAGAWYWYAEARWTTTPVLTTLSEQDARAAAAAAKLGLTTTQEYSEDVPAGTVIRTDPTGGTRILRDGTVDAVISKGPERFSTPTVTGLTLEQATAELSKVTLVVGAVTEAYDEAVPVGVVLTASVAPETPLKRGTPVDLVLSKGPQPIPISSYVGKDAAAAVAELQAAGFQVTTSDEHSKTVPAGAVISQTPAEGQGKRGDVITMVVSKGPVMVVVPGVRGKSQAEAVQALTDAGFQVQTKSIVNSGIAFGLAYGTDPAEGTSVPEGSTVVVLVG